LILVEYIVRFLYLSIYSSIEPASGL